MTVPTPDFFPGSTLPQALNERVRDNLKLLAERVGDEQLSKTLRAAAYGKIPLREVIVLPQFQNLVSRGLEEYQSAVSQSREAVESFREESLDEALALGLIPSGSLPEFLPEHRRSHG
ncbi:MAG: hypothetical protein LBI99_09825 [Propionibacteriaceae bacterium]|jgi:hypothetical protein|nr:hypothetical protein [Propionibacteriaceae bacterium]